jgi:hypothetical protein
VLSLGQKDKEMMDGYIGDLVTEFNQGVPTARSMEIHIANTHGDMDKGGDSFFDKLLVLTSNTPTDMARTIFGLVNFDGITSQLTIKIIFI